MAARAHAVGGGGAPGTEEREESIRARARHLGRTARLQAITAALSRALTPVDVARTLVERCTGAIAADEGSLWTVERDGTPPRLAFASGVGPDALARHERIARAGWAPAGGAAAGGRQTFAESRAEAAACWPGIEATLAGECAFAWLPLDAGGRTVGGACLSFHAARAFDYEDRVFLLVAAHLAGQALLRARLFASEHAARAEAEAERRRASFLAEASALLSSTLDREATVASLARLAVPAIADWCVVDVPEGLASGGMPAAVAHVDPEKAAMAREMRLRHPPDPGAPDGPAAVMRTGRAELHEQIPDEALVRAAADAAHLRTLRALEMRSAMIVPLRARDRTLGSITFVAAGSGRRYRAADLAMAEELGRRAGLALDHARLYDEAQRAIRARDEVLAIVSHDLKNPLEAIVLSAAALLRSPDAERVRRAAEAIRRSAGRMDRLIRDLLDLSSMDAGRFHVEPRPERLGPIVDEIVTLLGPVAAEKAIALVARGAGPDAVVRCDRERVLQVLSNLVGNALRHAPHGGRVEIRVGLREGEAEVTVADDGPGIPPEDLPRLFDRYWTRSRHGTGLGLAIARAIVEAHGGRIAVDSRLGAGAAFTFSIPLHGPRPA